MDKKSCSSFLKSEHLLSVVAMLPLIQGEVVRQQKWLKKEVILDIYAVSQSVPGVLAISSAIFVGERVAGNWGSIFAALGVILPSFIISLIIASALASFREYAIIDKIYAGIFPPLAALIQMAAVQMAKTAVKTKAGISITLVSFELVVIFDIHAVWAVMPTLLYTLIDH